MVQEPQRMTDREILQRFDALEEKLDAMGHTLKEVAANQRVTNGRVRENEIRHATMRGWFQALGLVMALPATAGSLLGIVLLLRNL